tara:strand:+ start:491 stop:955 length:465 start_codon:yes stop_codon:yes gene_type:complete
MTITNHRTEQNKFIKKSIKSYYNSNIHKSIYFKEIEFKRVKIKAKLSKNQRKKFLKYGHNPKIQINKLFILKDSEFISIPFSDELPFKNPNNHIIGNKPKTDFRDNKHNKRQKHKGIILNINGLKYDSGFFKNRDLILKSDYDIYANMINSLME